ncbi:DeoR faimly transcriptional regulator [Microbacterium mangrovi]|uniref:Riboflavin biosynthesis protein RibD n=1 Tax=Microbacterium mangrovi TaxID=1348253 RepID=A0A0B2AD51_9MICO|nr:bifunctional diaminohydroxyphosphoribosylaminopyrimidine deaminase/5-amino-6-(5-phosphoribosylamino)uracil reductase RibD [Microbacterium mangrovi]KHK99512.1 DeoR faimly transcriptional regulator [Microbacterium mangrovi]
MTVSETERAALRRALDAARRGPRGVNPQVGAVILSPAGDVIAEGWHRGAGTPHAEVDALSQLQPGQARGATAVVTLEPCNHTGRTGPCSQALIDAGVARVVYALSDPNPRAAGGAERLRTAGVDVDGPAEIGGAEQDAAASLLRDWVAVQRLHRPYVTVKWAQSLDGRAAAADGTSKWITGAEARADVGRRRAQADAILVGTGTVLADDPALTARDADGELLPDQPVPVVVGTRDVPADAQVRRHPHPLLQLGGGLPAVLEDLRERGIQRVFVEGGPTLATAFLREGLADEVLVYIAPKLIGRGADGHDYNVVGDIGVRTMSDVRPLRTTSVERLGDDLLIVAEAQAATEKTEENH